MSQVIKFNDQPQIDRGNGATTAPLFLKENGARSFISGISTFKPGVSVPVHSHNTDEMVIVLEGKGECEIDGVKEQVSVFDTSYITAGEPHCFRNTGDEDMKILWVYASMEVTRTFLDSGITVPHLSPEDRISR